MTVPTRFVLSLIGLTLTRTCAEIADQYDDHSFGFLGLLLLLEGKIWELSP